MCSLESSELPGSTEMSHGRIAVILWNAATWRALVLSMLLFAAKICCQYGPLPKQPQDTLPNWLTFKTELEDSFEIRVTNWKSTGFSKKLNLVS